MLNSKRTIILFLFIGVLVFASGCQQAASEENPTPTPIPTPIVPTKPTYSVQRGDVIEELKFNARIAPVLEESLFFRTDGRVRNVYFNIGDFVQIGDILADLEFLDGLERQYMQDQLSLRRAEINAENAQYYLDLFKLTNDSQELQEAYAQQAVAEAEKAVSEAERAYGITLSTANQASIDAAFAQMIVAQQSLDRAKENFKPYENKPEDNLTRAYLQSALSAAQQNYEAAVRNYNALTGTGSESDQNLAESQYATALAKLKDAQFKLELVQSGIGYTQELALQENNVALAEIALEEAKLSIQDLEVAIEDARLTSPIDGTILTLGLTDGRTVEAYRIYAVVADINELEIKADLIANDVEKLEAGLPVVVTRANRPGEVMEGTIRVLPSFGSSAASVGDEDKSTRITLNIDYDEAGLEVGDVVRVSVIIEKKENALWLPPQAIRIFDNREFVVIQDGDTQVRMDIKIGIETEDQVEILEGVEEGQIVIGP